MTRQLSVWLFGIHIGTLSQIDGRLNFSYESDWLNASHSIPLSQSLPLQTEAFDDRATRPFFSGLLPEGDKRKLIAQALHVSKQNDFALLDGIGGECAGAVTLLEPRQMPQAHDHHDPVRWLDEGELLRLLDEMPKRPMLAGEEGLRLSLAGAQDKLPVVAEGDRIGLPQFNSPSSHILKPAIAGVDGSVFNEGFCLALANALKLDTVKAEIRRISDRDYLLVDRYDRQVTADGRLMRLHQEDFCQALAVAPEYKYQNEGGPDLSQAFELVRRATRPSAPQILKLLDFAIFNAMVGNHDAHGKNFSLLYTTQGIVLAPCYDVLSTAVYQNLTDKMAMKIGSRYKFSEVQLRHWERFATAAGLSPAQVKKRILTIAGRLPELAAKTISLFEAEGNGHSILDKITALIELRCAQTIRCLTPE
jgi:serine/threonine-protein kinase HipA